MHDKQSKEVALREGLVTQVRARTDVGERQVRGHATVAERRGWERLPISIPFFVRGINPGNEEFLEFATALNVSAGGVLLAAKRYLDPGTKISLEVPVALINKAQLPHSIARLQATVLRCTADRQYFLLGVQFEEPLLRHDGNQNHDGA